MQLMSLYKNSISRLQNYLQLIFIAIVICVFTLIVPADLVGEAGIPLQEIRNKTGARLQWDPMRQMGSLEKGDTNLVYRIDSPFLVVNYESFRSIVPPERGERGDIWFSEEDASYLIDTLGLKSAQENQHYISTIIIDAGHGGKDSGAVGRFTEGGKQTVVMEKDLVLAVARQLSARLRSKYPEKSVLLTRDEDVYLTLEDRTQIANEIELGEQEAMIFISLHANASLNSKAEGFEVWYLPPDYRRKLIDPETLDESAREVAPILNTMLEEEYTVESILLARNILNGLDSSLGNEHVNRGLKEETWFVVRNAKMPSALVEIGFVTNREEALQMRSSSHLKKITDGIYNGVHGFIEHFENTSVRE
ncbi:MAG: N-acetylmuramoyl-L-alanine amidase [Spirochaetota bacterium]